MGNIVAMVILTVFLLIAGWCDIKTKKVPNKIVLPVILVGFVWWTVWGALSPDPDMTTWIGLRSSLFGFLAGFVPFAIVFASGALGGGDVKTMAAVGSVSAHWELVLSTTVYACVFAAIMAIFIMFKQGIVKQTIRRIFGMALIKASGANATLDDSSPSVPFAVAIAFGGILAGLEILLGISTPWAGFA